MKPRYTDEELREVAAGGICEKCPMFNVCVNDCSDVQPGALARELLTARERLAKADAVVEAAKFQWLEVKRQPVEQLEIALAAYERGERC